MNPVNSVVSRAVSRVVSRLEAAADRHAARARYFEVDRATGRIWRGLHASTDPLARAADLAVLAERVAELAHLHPRAVGPDPIPGEGGRDMAEALAWQAWLLHLAAAAEHALACGGGLDEAELAELADLPAEQELWRVLATTSERVVRAELYDRLWQQTVTRVGGQAAETLACLAAAERAATQPPSTAARLAHRAADLVETVTDSPAALFVLVVTLAVAAAPLWSPTPPWSLPTLTGAVVAAAATLATCRALGWALGWALATLRRRARRQAPR